MYALVVSIALGAPAVPTYSLTLEGQPTTLNALLRSVKGRIRQKKADRAWVALAAKQLGVPLAAGKRRVGLTVTLTKGQRAPDPDAFHKSLGDSLVCCGLLVNDSYKWVEWLPVKYARGERPLTVITLEDL